jgi:hypothetical protein
LSNKSNSNPSNSSRDEYNIELKKLMDKQKELEIQIRKLNMSEIDKTKDKTEDEDINIGNLVKVEDSEERDTMDIKLETGEGFNFCCKGRFCF